MPGTIAAFLFTLLVQPFGYVSYKLNFMLVFMYKHMSCDVT